MPSCVPGRRKPNADADLHSAGRITRWVRQNGLSGDDKADWRARGVEFIRPRHLDHRHGADHRPRSN